MSTAAGHLPRRPRAETMSIEELVEAVVDDHRVRVPRFQRRLRWGADDVRNLLDSVYRGYPIGSLLFWERVGEAEELVLGRLQVQAERRDDAWFVVDGQQRITALANALRRDDDIVDEFLVYFDLEEQAFRLPVRATEVSGMWLPAGRLLNAVDLNAWLIERFPDRRDIQRVAHEVGRRVREYRVPVYVVQTDDEAVLREIFRRANRHGEAMTQAEVFDALVGSAPGSMQRLDELADDLGRMGMGRPSEQTLLQVVHAVRGKDPTKLANPKDLDAYDGLEGSVGEAAGALRRVLAFLRDDVEIPHLRLLPYKQPLVVLSRFFHLFPEPSARSKELLSRWVWRGFITGAHADTRKPLREGVRTIEAGAEEASVQGLLRQLPPPLVVDQAITDWAPGAEFDARSAADRVAMLGLVSLEPRSLEDFAAVDVGGLLEKFGADAVQVLDGSGITGRILHTPIRRLVDLVAAQLGGAWPGVLASHALDAPMVAMLVSGNSMGFHAARTQRLRQAVSDLAQRKCASAYGDRPSISHLLADHVGQVDA